MSNNLLILGASGHGREIASVVRDLTRQHGNTDSIRGFLDDAPELLGKEIGGIPILGPIRDVAGYECQAILGVGYPELKARLTTRLEKDSLQWKTLIHPTAIIGECVTIGEGCFVQAGAVLTCEISLSEFVTLNIGVTVNHGARIGRLATLSPGASIGGNVSIGEGALIGIGASVVQNVNIGEWSVVGAGAVVIEDVAPNAVVIGVPARVLEIREPGWQNG